MRRIFCLVLTLCVLLAHNVWAQDRCSVTIIPSNMPACIMTDYRDGAPPVEESTECFKACKKSTVSYSVQLKAGESCSWSVTSANNYYVTNGGKTLNVTWSDANSGMIYLSLTTAGGHVCQTQQCVALIDIPEVHVTTFPPYRQYGDKRVIEVCYGQPIRFEDHSTAGASQIVGSTWKSSREKEEGLVYTTTNYSDGDEIRHTVINECGCEASETYIIIKRSEKGPELSCYGTVCGGATANYTLMDYYGCQEYNWIVADGTIVQGQGTQKIEVQWDNPTSGYGSIEFNCLGGGYICDATTVFRIPIISNKIDIRGEQDVCVGDNQIYEIPLWGTTKYTWRVTSTTNGSFKQRETETKNQLWLEFLDPGDYRIEVIYECPFLGCTGSSQPFTVKVKPKISIYSNQEEYCAGESASFKVVGNNDVLSWTVYFQENVYASGQGVTFTQTFTQSGNYRVVVSGGAYCGASELHFRVRELPALNTTTVTGPSVACPNSGIMLSAPLTAGRLYEWESAYMAEPTFMSQNDASIKFGNTVGDVKVRVVDVLTGCKSATYTHRVAPFVLAAANLPASLTVCEGDEITQAAPTQNLVNYTWSLSTSNMATITNGRWSSAVTVKIGSKDSPLTVSSQRFSLNLEREACGVKTTNSITLNATLYPPPAFTVNRTSACLGESITATITSPMSGVSYWWTVNGVTYTGNSVTYTANSPGKFEVVLYYQPDPQCLPRANAEEITINPLPDLFITYNDNANPVHITTDATQNMTFSWTRNGTTLSGANESGLYATTSGTYCCTATNAYGCSKTFCKTITVPPAPAPVMAPAPAIAPTAPTASESLNAPLYATTAAVPLSLIVDQNCNSVQIRTPNNIPASTLTWVEDCPSDMISDVSTYGNTRYLQFTRTGYCRVSVSGTYNGVYYEGSTTIAIPVMAKALYQTKCNMVSVSDLSTYIHGHIVQPRKFTVYDEYSAISSVTMTGNATTTSVSVNLPITDSAYYTYLLENEDCYVKTPHTFYKIPTVVISHTGGECMESDIHLKYNLISGNATPLRWYIDNISYTIYPGIDHILYSTTPDPDIILAYADRNGCVRGVSYGLQLYSNPLVGKIVTPNYAPCLGDMYPLTYQTNAPFNGTIAYQWKPNETITGAVYPAYKTDDYAVVVSDAHLCMYRNTKNIVFINKPVAKISGKTNYCKNDTVKLDGFSGDNNRYSWLVTEPNGSRTSYNGSALSFPARQSGTYTVELTAEYLGCSNSDIVSVVVQSVDFKPSIIQSGSCIHNPPVIVSASPMYPFSIYWSNGQSGDYANYYQTGAATAWYYDPETGCKSDQSEIIILPQPNYEALLTGCYEKCDNFFPYKWDLYSLVPYNLYQWEWWRNNSLFDRGRGYTPTAVSLNGNGVYYMKNEYVAGCTTISPNLMIQTRSECSCTDMAAMSYYIKNITCYIKSCQLTYSIDIILINSSGNPITFDQLELQHGSSLYNSPTLPFTVMGHSSIGFNIGFTPDVMHATSFVFRFHSYRNNCYFDIPISLTNDSYYNYNRCKIGACKDNGSIYYTKWVREKELPFTYYDIGLRINNGSGYTVMEVWTETGEILQWNAGGNGIVDLQYLYDYDRLLQMANEKKEVCFNVMICDGKYDEYCIVKICYPAEKLIGYIRGYRSSMVQEESTRFDLSPTPSGITNGKPQVVPNPAINEFRVIGIAEKEIAELKLLTLAGSEVNMVTQSASMSIENIASGAYIVRVITNTKEVYYLKLIKQ